MLLYEHDRTQDIVSRLVTAGNMIRTFVIGACILGVGAALAVVGAAIAGPGLGGLIGFIVGGALGYVAGTRVGVLTTAGIEWMGQLLVVQGEILVALKERP